MNGFVREALISVARGHSLLDGARLSSSSVQRTGALAGQRRAMGSYRRSAALMRRSSRDERLSGEPPDLVCLRWDLWQAREGMVHEKAWLAQICNPFFGLDQDFLAGGGRFQKTISLPKGPVFEQNFEEI